MKRLVVDLDDTLTISDSSLSYSEKIPNWAVVEKLREYKANGFEVILMTARNMMTYNNSIGKINANTLPVIVEWLNRHSIPFDEIHVGKPWCGHDGFYVDDRAVRPAEFTSLTLTEIHDVLARDR